MLHSISGSATHLSLEQAVRAWQYPKANQIYTLRLICLAACLYQPCQIKKYVLYFTVQLGVQYSTSTWEARVHARWQANGDWEC